MMFLHVLEAIGITLGVVIGGYILVFTDFVVLVVIPLVFLGLLVAIGCFAYAAVSS